MYALVDVLVPSIKVGKLREFTAILDWDIYNRAVLGPLKDVYHNPYLLLLGAVMGQMVKGQQVASVTESDLIHFWLDDQILKVEQDAHKHFLWSKESLPQNSRIFDTVMFRDDKYCYPLRADFIRSESRDELDRVATTQGGIST